MRELRWALAVLPLYLLVLPWLLRRSALPAAEMNLALYGAAALLLCPVGIPFLSRSALPLRGMLPRRLGEAVRDLFLCLLMNLAVGLLLAAFHRRENPNNAAVVQLLTERSAWMLPITVLAAPVLEELLLRGAVFGALHGRSRALAYLVSVGFFSLMHVTSFLSEGLSNLWYALQYVPASVMLCRSYERSGSIWCSILLHSLLNAASAAMILI